MKHWSRRGACWLPAWHVLTLDGTSAEPITWALCWRRLRRQGWLCWYRMHRIMNMLLE